MATSQLAPDPGGSSTLDRLAADTIRCLAMDAVQQADSGHPGLPMAMAPVAYTLYTRFLDHDPAAPQWPDRDRFVLSAGGSPSPSGFCGCATAQRRSTTACSSSAQTAT
jgi:transketolase